MYKTIFLFIGAFLLIGCSRSDTVDNFQETKDCIKQVKYRTQGQVNVCNSQFIKFNNVGDTIVLGAWYDKEKQYMIIQLLKINYHYCNFPESEWINFSQSVDSDEYYPRYIRGKFDCRMVKIPVY